MPYRQVKEVDVKELLVMSTLYYELISDLTDLFGVDLKPDIRSRAFQIVSDFADEIKMKTLATAVLADLKKENQK